MTDEEKLRRFPLISNALELTSGTLVTIAAELVKAKGGSQEKALQEVDRLLDRGMVSASSKTGDIEAETAFLQYALNVARLIKQAIRSELTKSSGATH